MFDDKKRGPRPARGGAEIPPARRIDGAEAPARGDPKGEDYRRENRPRYAGYSQLAPDSGAAGRARAPGARRTPPAELSEDMLVGRNPIREALRAGARVEKLIVAEGDLSGAARDIIALAREKGVLIQKVSRTRLDQIYPAHQGMIAYIAQAEYSTLEDMLAFARSSGEAPFIVVLDGITDPHNMGAIIRSAECAGAHGVIIPERRACGLTAVVSKAAAGALAYMRVARVTNINRAIEKLKQAGLWICAAALDGEDALAAELSGPIALVIGSEGDGIARLTLEKCDRRLTLPMKGHIDSLNASVAAGILMYEVMRARRMP